MASSTSQRERFTILLAFRKGLSMKPVNNKVAAAAFSLAAPGAPAAQAAGVQVLNGGSGNVSGSASADSLNHVGPGAVRRKVHA